jgi:NADH:ubiquinone oxidoreductase subunit 6 (subunit J)
MDPMQIIFFIFAVITLGAAFLVVTAKSLVHSALWLILALFGVAVLYVSLDAGFFAAAQVLIYIGAIAILFIFAVMLTRKDLRDAGMQQTRTWPLAALLAVVLFAGLFFVLSSWSPFTMTRPDLPSGTNTIADLGQALVSADAYLLPFELASILLVAAMIGAIYVSLNKK